MEIGDKIIISAATCVILCCGKLLRMRKKKRTRRRWWMTSVNRSRGIYNGTNLLADLLKEPSGKFENFCRMSFEDFEYLLCKIEPIIAKKDTKWRKAIPAKERLALTLRFLASEDSFQSLHYLFKISPQLISMIVPEVCSAIIRVLKEYIKIPSNTDEWKKVADVYAKVWNFPNCIGSLDGKHITIQAPINSGTEYYNYKQNFSIVLFALVDADYCFMFADCGCQGRISDGGVYRNTELYTRIENDKLNCPPDDPFTGRNKPVPYVFVGDDAFGLSERIMKPYPGQHEKGSKARIFNYRLSRARRIVENVFGIMASVFRVLRKPMLLQPNKVALITMTCVLLHNFLRKRKASRSNYSPHGTFDFQEGRDVIPGSWREDQDNMSSLLPLRRIPRKSTIQAKEIRDEFAEYFVTSGKVEWQDGYC